MINRIKISELPEAESTRGLYTIGVTEDGKNVKVKLETFINGMSLKIDTETNRLSLLDASGKELSSVDLPASFGGGVYWEDNEPMPSDVLWE